MKFRYATLEEIPEALRAYYKQKDGAGDWILECDGAADMKKLTEFRDTNTRLMKLNADLTTKFKDVDADEYTRLKSIETDLQNGKISGTKAEELLKQRTDEMKKAHEKVVAELTTKLTGAETNLSRLMINDAAVQAGLKKGLRKEAAPDLQTRVAGVFRLKDGKPVAMNGDGTAELYGKDGTPLTIEEFIDGLVVTAVHLFDPSGGTGAGGSGGSGGGAGGQNPVNPWKKETMNVTKQAALVKENPKKAAELARQAGAKVTWVV